MYEERSFQVIILFLIPPVFVNNVVAYGDVLVSPFRLSAVVHCYYEEYLAKILLLRDSYFFAFY